ncbi:putative ubiquinone biosynthesis monooxygenase [Tieghemiomyces parasiticus]|uniref:Ubiquinone biosynthesis monooxygenase COQ6, mitochondrial n=1 Tax=Tieghemiomyces parasiticus TaxID=78921 RepID=A0A9W7ZS64_9FUNG|nr:putative ubiquinone biosynthesis monooxygenase [Tieghemiomyces parasiticus]
MSSRILLRSGQRLAYRLQPLSGHHGLLNRHGAASTYSVASARTELFDVVIVGGGIAGATLARGLVLRGRKVALVESSDLSKVRNWDGSNLSTVYSNRTVSITPASQTTLTACGVWSEVDQSRIQPYCEMHVWDGVSNGQVNFNSRDLTSPETLAAAGRRDGHEGAPMAWIMENLNLHRAALRALDRPVAAKTVEVVDQTRVETITAGSAASLPHDTDPAVPSEWPRVHLSSGRTLAARLLVGADGANSPVRSYSKIGSAGWPYEQHGIVATLKLEGSTANTAAWQRFLPTGPVAILPMPNNYAALVWSMDKAHVPGLKALNEADFATALNVALRLPFEDLQYLLDRLGNDRLNLTAEYGQSLAAVADTQSNSPLASSLPPWVARVEPHSRASFPYKLQHADRYIGQRVALIGDAAHTVHPLAGQGLNLGMLDVASLLRVLETAVLNGQDIGDYNCLLGYSSERYFPNLAMVGAVDKLQRLFSTSFGPLAAVRSLGLNAVNHFPLLKNEFVKVAMG